MPFLQPFTYKETNLNIIYMATDYSMYTARTGSRLKLTGDLYLGSKTTVCQCEQSGERGDLAEKQRFWKSSSNKDCIFSFYFTTISMYYKMGSPKHTKITCKKTYFRHAWSHNSQFSHDWLHLLIAMLVTVYSDDLEKISVHLLTDIQHSGNRRR